MEVPPLKPRWYLSQGQQKWQIGLRDQRVTGLGRDSLFSPLLSLQLLKSWDIISLPRAASREGARPALGHTAKASAPPTPAFQMQAEHNASLAGVQISAALPSPQREEICFLV